MGGKRIPWLVGLVVALAACGFLTASAAPPWGEFLTFNRMEADPDKAYRVSEDNGPWMIMACSFSGDGAAQQAQELVHELRKRYKLPAYTHRMRFDFSEVRGRGIDQFGGPMRMRHKVDDLEEVAVLVGDYRGVDDPRAQQTLRKLKYSRPECLAVDEGKPTSQSLAGWRMTQRRLQELIGSRKKEKGPTGHAFVTTNPLLPEKFFKAAGIDPLVLEMNEHVTHGLLNCPGKYTVQVATFKGHVIIDPGEIEAIERGKELGSKLAEAAQKAHKLTEALRLKGWEAYEFHDRYASIVTVGSFDSVGTPNADARIELHPQIHAVVETFRAQPTTLPGQASSVTPLKSLLGIPFDIQPRLVEVPKRSLSREMARGLF